MIEGEPYGAASDVWALGCALFELLAGAGPYRSASIVSVAERAAGGGGTVTLAEKATAEAAADRGMGLERLRRELRGDIETVVRKALAGEPGERYASAGDLAGDLRRYLESRPVLAKRQTVGYRLQKYASRNRGAVAVTVLLAMGLAGSLGYGFWQQRRALAEEPGSLLVFLPGQGEILRTADLLRERIKDPTVDIAPLFGAMDREAQDRAVQPATQGRRKVVLATYIAETSLTIEGVRVVIDSGLARVQRYEPDLGLSRLETQRVSRAAADQRRGRAGRTEPGVCYRLWEEASTGAMEPYAAPEILSADLSGLVLDLAAWGARDPASLAWLDAPPAPAVKEARTLLRDLHALDGEGAITDEGRAIRALPLPPRLARMVVDAARAGEAGLAAQIALVLVERGLGGDGADIADRVQRLRADRSRRAEDGRRLAGGWEQAARRATGEAPIIASDVLDCGRLLALAWPDRIAKARGKPGEFLMANGRAAFVEPHDRLAREPYLAIAEVTGKASAARILSAAALSAADLEASAGARLVTQEATTFDRSAAALRTRRTQRLGAITLSEQTRPTPATPDSAAELARGLASLGLERLPWTKAQSQLRDRVLFLRRTRAEDWPDLSLEALAQSPESWLAPFIEGRTSLASITPDDLDAALDALLPWDLKRRLDAEAPTHFEAPTGSRVAVDYEAEGGPVLAIRVQELFGLSTHPSLAQGRAPLTLHLLSPAHRPIQITRDLPGFWKGSWAAVKADMKGRYPRHPWPDDPAAAAPTTRAKPRGT
jgi:ATP-dependent helicase HrpB